MRQIALRSMACFFTSILVLGCSPFKDHNESFKASSCNHLNEQDLAGCDPDWPSKHYIQRAINEQIRQDYPEQVIKLRDLQKQADVLMQFKDRENINVLCAPNHLPLGTVPLAGVQKYLASNRGTAVAIGLVVIIVPPGWPQYEEGRPDGLTLVRTLDKALRNAGVKRRVFETFDDHDCLKLDSADVNFHVPSGP